MIEGTVKEGPVIEGTDIGVEVGGVIGIGVKEGVISDSGVTDTGV